MSKRANPDLSLKDIKFLKAIRDINRDPETYEATEHGAVPATITAVKEATSLTKDEVDYRMTPSRSRLANTDEGLGLIHIHEAELRGNMFGPKSAELTEKGERMLNDTMETHGLTDRSTAETEQLERLADVDARTHELEERMDDIEARIEEIVAAVNDIAETVDQWDEAPTGAFNSDERDKFNALVQALPGHDRAFRALGIDPAALAEEETIDETTVQKKVRENLLDTDESNKEGATRLIDPNE